MNYLNEGTIFDFVLMKQNTTENVDHIIVRSIKFQRNGNALKNKRTCQNSWKGSILYTFDCYNDFTFDQ